jgi:hypothetical protein
MKSIKLFFLFLWEWRKHLKFYLINRKLKKAVISKTKERLQLRYDISRLIMKYAKWDKDHKSKYIPLDEKTRIEIRFQVDLKYGEKMKALNVKLNHQLQVI